MGDKWDKENRRRRQERTKCCLHCNNFTTELINSKLGMFKNHQNVKKGFKWAKSERKCIDLTKCWSECSFHVQKQLVKSFYLKIINQFYASPSGAESPLLHLNVKPNLSAGDYGRTSSQISGLTFSWITSKLAQNVQHFPIWHNSLNLLSNTLCVQYSWVGYLMKKI